MNLTNKQIDDFMKKAAFIANHSTCGYKVGCCGVVRNPNLINTHVLGDTNVKIKGDFLYIKTWNKTLKGEVYCKEKCIREEQNLKGKEFEKVCSIHAEQNLIAKCAKYQISTKGMIMFVTNSPCYICAKSIIQAGISEVYYLAEHTDKSGIQILTANNIKTQLVKKLD